MSLYDIMERGGSPTEKQMPRREPDFHEKRRFDDGATLEVTICALRSPVAGSQHGPIIRYSTARTESD